jgi:hypothetical protein
MSDSTSDINAQQMYEQTALGPESRYLTKAEMQRDISHPAYAKDETFRLKVEAKIIRSMETLVPQRAATPNQQPAQVTAKIDAAGNTTFMTVAGIGNVGSIDAVPTHSPAPAPADTAPKVIRTPFGAVIASVRVGTPEPEKVKPLRDTGVGVNKRHIELQD